MLQPVERGTFLWLSEEWIQLNTSKFWKQVYEKADEKRRVSTTQKIPKRQIKADQAEGFNFKIIPNL